MFNKPQSLTATVYVKFHYKEPESKVEAGEVEKVNIILDKASDMSPELRELLIKFANYLAQIETEEGK